MHLTMYPIDHRMPYTCGWQPRVLRYQRSRAESATACIKHQCLALVILPQLVPWHKLVHMQDEVP
eukprot:2010615-Pyramimonas_sp.AAC.1